MLTVLTLAVMFVVGYSFLREGLATAFCMLINVLLAGIVAFNFFEPIADELDDMFLDSFLHGYEDFICLGGLFALSLGLLRLATNHLLPVFVEFTSWLQQLGSVFLGLLTGYLLAGFLVCALQTLPWHERFMNFEPYVDLDNPASRARRWLPPDRVWLALMSKVSAMGLSWDGPEFDQHGNFELRYARHRRYADDRDVLPSSGEETP